MAEAITVDQSLGKIPKSLPYRLASAVTRARLRADRRRLPLSGRGTAKRLLRRRRPRDSVELF